MGQLREKVWIINVAFKTIPDQELSKNRFRTAAIIQYRSYIRAILPDQCDLIPECFNITVIKDRVIMKQIARDFIIRGKMVLARYENEIAILAAEKFPISGYWCYK